tara:strand:- start:933 stop:3740 length:2808 start_codon:yes stop_codon:yes gene_type:complete
MSEMNVGQFVKMIEKEVGHPIYRRIIVQSVKGKKKPRGERNTMTPEAIGAFRGYDEKCQNKGQEYTDWSVALKHCPGYWLVDCDEKTEKALQSPLIAKLIADGCYSTETKKGFHFYIKCPDAPTDITNELDVFKDFQGDFLGRDKGNNVWETKSRMVEGNHFAEFSWAELSEHINLPSTAKTSAKDKKKKELKKARVELKKKKQKASVDDDPEGFDDPAPEDAQIKGYLDRINTDKHYDDWLRVGICLFNIYRKKSKGLKFWMEWSQRNTEKNDDDTTEEKYDTFKINHPDPLGWKSLRQMANTDDPQNIYEEAHKSGGADKLTLLLNKELMFNTNTGEVIRVFLNVGKHEANKWNTFKMPAITQAYMKYTFFITLEDGKKVKTNPAAIWNSNGNRRDVKRIAFDARPDGERDPNIFNIWQGYNVNSEDAQVFDEDDADAILDHIFNIWCQGNTEHYEYVINWFAHILQKPWIKIGTLLALKSDQGAGKGIIFDMIGKIMGSAHYSQSASMANITGDFNGGIEGKVLIDLDEAFWGGEVKMMGKMKNLITERSQLINKKCKEAYEVENTTAFSITTNNSLFAGVEKGDRRHMCLNLDNKYAGIETPETRVYIEAVRGAASGKEVPEKVYGAFAKFLYNVNLDGFRPRKIPRTELLQDQIERGWGSVVRWWKDCLSDGSFGLADYDKQYKNTGANDYNSGQKKTEYDVSMECYGYIKDLVNGRIVQETYPVKDGVLRMAFRKSCSELLRDPKMGETKKQYIERVFTEFPWHQGSSAGIKNPDAFSASSMTPAYYYCGDIVWDGEAQYKMKKKTHTLYKGYNPQWLYQQYVEASKTGSVGFSKAETYNTWRKEMAKMWNYKEKKHGAVAGSDKREKTWEVIEIKHMRVLFNKAQQWEYDWEEGEEIMPEMGGVVEQGHYPGQMGNVGMEDGCMIDDE